jgi:type VII secretion integral membrane protein EccD
MSTTATSVSALPPADDVCRLTVQGLSKRADLAVPATMTIGQLLPVLLPDLLEEGALGTAWVLQRLGGGPLDPDTTIEALDLREGEILHLRPSSRAMTAMEFDDIAVGVAALVGARTDRVRPDVTRALLLAAGCLGLAAFVAGAFTARPEPLISPALGAGAVALIVTCIVLVRSAGDTAAGVSAGLCGCVLAMLAGLTAFQRGGNALAVSPRDVMVAGAAVMAAAVTVLATRRVPVALFGAVLATGTYGLIGAWLSLAFHWAPAKPAAVLAVAIFVAANRTTRLIVRAARLRVPLLPRNTRELQEDADPEPSAEVASRSDTAIGYLDALVLAAAATFAVAAALLACGTQWADWVLALDIGAAALLRARKMGGMWQCTALSVSGTVGIALVLAEGVARAGRLDAVLLLAVLLLAGVALLGARRMPGRRQPPIWGELADRLEMLTALALIPVLLQVLHVYGYFRSLIG